MRERRIASFTILSVLVCTSACGSGPARSSGEVVTTRLVVHDTVISTASELIGGVSDMVVGPDGRLYIVDYQSHSILSVRPDGTDPRTFGREGAGPGEFRTPLAIAISSDSIWVYDMENARVQTLDLTGAYRGQYRWPLPYFGRAPSLNDRGALVVATGGEDSALVVVVRGGESEPIPVGEPVAPPVEVFNLTSIRERIRKGEIPEEFRNDVLPVWGDDESIFVLFLSQPEIRRYDLGGDLLWTRTIDEPVLESVREAFFRKNRESTNPLELFALSYFQDGQVVDGDLWVLLNSEGEEDGIVLVLDGEDGSMRRRLVLDGLGSVSRFAIDPSRGRMYVSVPDEAMVVAFSVE